MEGVKDYQEYEDLFKDDLVKAVRKVLKRLEDRGDEEFEDSDEHGNLIVYFNKFALHKKITKEQFLNWK